MKPQHYNKTQLKGHNVKSLIEENLVADLVLFYLSRTHSRVYYSVLSRGKAQDL